MKDEIVSLLIMLDTQILPMINLKVQEFEIEIQDETQQFYSTKQQKDKQQDLFICEKILTLRLKGDLYRYLSELGQDY